jgi:hypothetical protein
MGLLRKIEILQLPAATALAENQTIERSLKILGGPMKFG